MAKLTYKDAGVDADEFDGALDELHRLMHQTFGPRVIPSDNNYAGMFVLNPDRVFGRAYRDPVLVGCADGVGTKLKVAFMMDKHDTVGIDLVAMNVNDLICLGASPLFFLDYVATGKLEKRKFLDIIRGIAEGCSRAECALLGGETAEMPGFYAEGEYDLAGFVVGATERHRRLEGYRRVRVGDAVIGLASSGLHSNGFSLTRKVFFDTVKMKVEERVPDLGRPLGEELLEPTRIYSRAICNVLRTYRRKRVPHAIAHITGGGLVGNVPRVIPDRCTVRLRKGSWPIPPIFGLIQRLGGVEADEMYRVYNMGIGLVVIVPPYYADSIVRQLKQSGETPHMIGEVVEGNRQVVIE
jgi:phosphoribosylformylglycinamidine cyclo-ligase